MSETFEYKGYQLPVELVNKTGAGIDSFDAISSWHIAMLQQYIGIKPEDAVLEVGCGIGRDAIPLTEILSSQGSYIGTDVIKPSVDWCQQNIGGLHKNFKFVWHNISDDLHNPEGNLNASNITLPCEDSSIDLIILQSVFTHMFEDEIIHYMTEFQRILKPKGSVWTSVFIVDDQILAHVGIHAPTSYALSFKHKHGDQCYINNADSKRGAVAFTRDAFDRMVRASGLSYKLEPLKGSWSGVHENAASGQDVLILGRP